MSTADMEFLTAPEIREGLKTYIDTVIQGYTDPTQAYFDAVLDWQRRRHGYEGKQEWIVTTSGVVPAIFFLVNLLTEPGDGIIIQQPVYYPFSLAAKLTGRRLVNNALIRKEGTYEIDFDDLEAKARDPRNKILIFCNPHNPVGKVWSREDLARLVEICAANHVFIIDDEIHNDLVMPGHRHTALPTVSAEASRICAYCTAPSKTFNLAGMQLSNIFIEDPEVRGRLSLSKLMGMSLSQVAISYEACRLAYEKGEPWLEELLQVVDGNAKYVASFLAEHIPQARCYPLEGTYLLWVDFGGLDLHHKELERLMLSAKLFLDEGAMFGKEGRGFERFNLALPRSAVESAMARLLKAWQDLQADWAANGRLERLTLEAGMKMPDFTYDTPFASGLSFAEECGGRPTVLLFHRYYGCSACNAAMERLAADYDAVTAAGGQVKVVVQSAPERVREAMGGEKRFPFDVVCDPERTLYERFSVFPADTMFDLAGDDLQALLPMAAGMFFGSGREDAPHEGLQDQLPAWFAVDGDGVVRRAHYGESVFDVPDAAAMAEAIRGMDG
jgi:aminotransferase/cystathionine beta-lyase